MKKLSNLFMVFMVLLFVSCSMSAKNDKNTKETTTAASKGEVVMLDKENFLAKVFNYEKNPTTWVYEGDKPCIIDFYADWCGPCKKIAPILKDLADEYKNDIVIYKIDVDKEKELATFFGIQSIPMVLFVPKEGMPMQSLGALPREEFVKQIDSYLLDK